MKIAIYVVSLLIAATAAIAGDASPAAGGKTKYTFGLIAKSQSYPVFQAALKGAQAASKLQARVRGVLKKAKELGYTIDPAKDVFYHKETPQDAANRLEEVQNNNPEIVGWALVGGWPLFTDSLLKMEPGKVKIVSVDA